MTIALGLTFARTLAIPLFLAKGTDFDKWIDSAIGFIFFYAIYNAIGLVFGCGIIYGIEKDNIL